MAYDGSVELISGIVQKNGGSFPLVDAPAVRVDDNTRLDAKLSGLDSDISDLNGDLSTANGNITTLQGKMTTAEGNITNLQGEVSDMKADIIPNATIDNLVTSIFATS